MRIFSICFHFVKNLKELFHRRMWINSHTHLSIINCRYKKTQHNYFFLHFYNICFRMKKKMLFWLNIKLSINRILQHIYICNNMLQYSILIEQYLSNLKKIPIIALSFNLNSSGNIYYIFSVIKENKKYMFL